jgi:hypothetical protein
MRNIQQGGGMSLYNQTTSQASHSHQIMSLKFGRFELEGPFSKLADLNEAPGVFALFCHVADRYDLLDVREAADVQAEVARTIETGNWTEVCTGKLRVGVYYSTNPEEVESVRREVLLGVGSKK